MEKLEVLRAAFAGLVQKNAQYPSEAVHKIHRKTQGRE